ncbi:MAG: M24 family metallopeptidase [Candidatus Bipolaricaulota bacterium]
MNTRIERLQDYIEEKDLDGFLVINLEASPDSVNQRYLVGFYSSLGSVIVGRDEAVFLTDSRYYEAATEKVSEIPVEKIDSKAVESTVARIEDMGLTRVGIDENNVTLALFNELNDSLEGVELVPVDGPVPDLRTCKDREEIELHKSAAEIADDTFAYLMDYVKPGMTESEIAVELEFFMKKQGAESVSFDPIVALGANSALPHATPGDREVREGDILLIDMGAKYRGYCSDMTRTVFIGEPTDKMQEVYEIVLEAQEVGLAALGPGESTKEVDGKARDVIEEHGYGDKYGHGLGHGVGLEIHEKPRLAQTEDNVLEEGMVVTVEPGIYLPGWGGVRIEDMVYITEKGYEFFSWSPKKEVFNPLG